MHEFYAYIVRQMINIQVMILSLNGTFEYKCSILWVRILWAGE